MVSALLFPGRNKVLRFNISGSGFFGVSSVYKPVTMPESVMRDELVALGIRVQGFVKLRWWRCDHDATTDLVRTLCFILSVAVVRDVPRVPSMNEQCRLHVSGRDVHSTKWFCAVQVLPSPHPHVANLNGGSPMLSCSEAKLSRECQKL